MRKVFIGAIVLCTAFLVVILAFAAGKPGFDAKEIRIAQWGPQTGPAAPWGSVARGSDLLFKMVNDEGGIHGRKIKYFIRDDQYNPAQAKAVVKELVEREGIAIHFPREQTCCGQPAYTSGYPDEARAVARRAVSRAKEVVGLERRIRRATA